MNQGMRGYFKIKLVLVDISHSEALETPSQKLKQAVNTLTPIRRERQVDLENPGTTLAYIKSKMYLISETNYLRDPSRLRSLFRQ